MSFARLIEHSRRYGSDPAFVLLGGGNTSVKEGNVLYVKASGYALGTIGEEGFVRMDLQKLSQIWEKTYSEDDDKREDEVLSDMMDCRLAGETARPSVEALLHALLPFKYVVHLHPAMVNGITCSRNGQETVHHLFPGQLWVDLVKPGFILAHVVKELMAEQKAKDGTVAQTIFLQNHGVFVGAETLEDISSIYDRVMQTIDTHLFRRPDFTALEMDQEKVAQIKAELKQLTSSEILAALNVEFSNYLQNEEEFAAVSSSFTPDHIVYAGFMPLWVGKESSVGESFKAFEAHYGVKPKIVCVQDTAVFSIGEKPLPLFYDSVSISVYSESFGGPLFMTDEMIDFIRNWEVEKYRSSVVTK